MKAFPRRVVKLFSASLFLVLALTTQTGCLLVAAGVAGGAAGYCYSQGKVCQSFRADPLDTRLAARSALAELGMQIVGEKQEGNEGYLETRTTQGERVRIFIESYKSRVPADGWLTRVCVRVATFGDQSLSTRILEQISRHLIPVNEGNVPLQEVIPSGAPPTATTPQTPPPPLLPPGALD